MNKREVTGSRSGEQGKQYNEEGVSSKKGSSRGGQDWGCDTTNENATPDSLVRFLYS